MVVILQMLGELEEMEPQAKEMQEVIPFQTIKLMFIPAVAAEEKMR